MTALSGERAFEPPTVGTMRVASRIVNSGRIVSRLVWDQGSARSKREASVRLGRSTVRLSRACAELCRAHGIVVEVRGEPPRGAAALVSNHVGYVDPIAILARVPAAPIAKREVSEWPLLGSAMDRSGVLWVDRACPLSGAHVLRRSLRAFASDVPVLVFPEGTTTLGDDALPFRRGLFGAAALARVPVVPVSLRYCSRELSWVGDEEFVPHYLRTARRPVTTVTVRFHAPLHPSAGEPPEALAERARAEVRAALREPGER